MCKKISALIILILVCVPVLALEFPEPVGFINDKANILSAETKSTLEQYAVNLEKATSAELVVVTVPSLEDNEIADYAYKLFKDKKWGIGKEDKDNGVLLLVAPNERKSHIEIGKGLEGRLTDGKTGYMQDELFIPYAKEGDYDKGISTLFKGLCTEVAAEYNIDPSTIMNASDVTNVNYPEDDDSSFMFIIILILILLFGDRIFFKGAILAALLSSGSRRGGGGSGGGFGGGSGGGFGGFGGGSSGGGGSSRSW